MLLFTLTHSTSQIISRFTFSPPIFQCFCFHSLHPSDNFTFHIFSQTNPHFPIFSSSLTSDVRVFSSFILQPTSLTSFHPFVILSLPLFCFAVSPSSHPQWVLNPPLHLRQPTLHRHRQPLPPTRSPCRRFLQERGRLIQGGWTEQRSRWLVAALSDEVIAKDVSPELS